MVFVLCMVHPFHLLVPSTGSGAVRVQLQRADEDRAAAVHC